MNNPLLALLVVAVAAAGCSRESAGPEAAIKTRAPTAAEVEPVAAVLQTGGAPVVKAAYVMSTKPVAGAPAELRVDLSSTIAVSPLQVQIEAESLAIDPATAQASVVLEAGKPSAHLVRYTPQREGLTMMTVRLRAADSVETVYAIPVLVVAATGG